MAQWVRTHSEEARVPEFDFLASVSELGMGESVSVTPFALREKNTQVCPESSLTSQPS